MLANIIAYGTAALLLSLGLCGLFGVATDRFPPEKDAGYLLTAAIMIFLAWLVAWLAGI